MIPASIHPPGHFCFKHTATTTTNNKQHQQHQTLFFLSFFPFHFDFPSETNMLDPHTNPQHDHPFLFNSGPEKRSDTYDTWQPINYSSRAEKTAQNYRSWKSMGAVRFNAAEESPSGVCSPPLWKTTTTSPPKSPNRSLNNYRSLSPASRTQAIARGQRELMDMVRNMPESCYELSLKDLVERRTMVDVEVDDEDAGTEILVKREDGKLKKKIDRKKPMVMRSGSIDSGGFLLKMVFPISLGSNKKNKITMINKNKKNKSDFVVEDRVSPKPCVDKDWWKRKVSASGESGGSESGVSSIISGSIKSSSGSSSSSCSSRSSGRRKTGGCWSFILLKKKRQD